jgi:hypothetical protein
MPRFLTLWKSTSHGFRREQPTSTMAEQRTYGTPSLPTADVVQWPECQPPKLNVMGLLPIARSGLCWPTQKLGLRPKSLDSDQPRYPQVGNWPPIGLVVDITEPTRLTLIGRWRAISFDHSSACNEDDSGTSSHWSRIVGPKAQALISGHCFQRIYPFTACFVIKHRSPYLTASIL